MVFKKICLMNFSTKNMITKFLELAVFSVHKYPQTFIEQKGGTFHFNNEVNIPLRT